MDETTTGTGNMVILMADDDPEDCALTLEALREAQVENPLQFVRDGEELMRYLRREGPYADTLTYPAPGLILLDLNMPRMDGREALAEIKADPRLRHIPVVVLTTSRSKDDVLGTYQDGASSYITKPSTYQDMLALARELRRYWLEVVNLPLKEPAANDG